MTEKQERKGVSSVGMWVMLGEIVLNSNKPVREIIVCQARSWSGAWSIPSWWLWASSRWSDPCAPGSPRNVLIRISHLTLHNLSNSLRIPLSQPPLTSLSHNQYPSLSTFLSHSRVHSHPIRSSCLCLTFPNLPQVSIPPCITWDCFRCTITTKFSFPTLLGLFMGLLFTLHRVTLLILQMFHFL